ncbi:hypothetical protein PQX77_007319 [Marasmius sp. AFHP31]|nr:hypothetical protein PQX77_007319 [Marasmius sp. AFHP31]
MMPLDTEKDRDLEDLRRWFRLKFTDSGSTGINHPSANDIVVQSTIHGKHASKPELNSSEDAESDSSNDSSSDSDVPLAKSDTLKRSAASQLAVVNKRQRNEAECANYIVERSREKRTTEDFVSLGQAMSLSCGRGRENGEALLTHVRLATWDEEE